MSNLEEALEFTRSMGQKAAGMEDQALAQYIKSQADYIVSQGKDLTEYDLVRDSGSFSIDDDTATCRVRYGLIHKSKIIHATWSDDTNPQEGK